MTMHKLMAETMDTVIEKIKAIQKNARENNDASRPKWPMIVLRTPKGWTGPKVVDGNQIEGTFRAHQVPMDMSKPEHLEQLKEWMLSYKPEELFDENGILVPEIAALAPEGNHRMGANPHANGGLLLRDLRMPDFRDYAFDVPFPGSVEGQDMIELGGFVRDIFKLNKESKTSVYSVLTKLCQTDLAKYLKKQTVTGTVKNTIMTNFLQQTAELWTQCFRNICVKVGLRAIF